MAVDLGDLIDRVKNSADPTGTLYTELDDNAWITKLVNSFWEIRLNGMFLGHEENAAARGGPAVFADAIVTPLGVAEGYDEPNGWASSDLPPEHQQFIVVWASYKTALIAFQNLKARFRAKAGPTEFEEENSATMLKAILDQLYDEIKRILANLSDYGIDRSGALVIDSVIERSYSTAVGDTWWVKA